MKRLSIVLLSALFLGACEKVPETGSMDITVSYYYNEYQGYKPDVGAKAYLYNDEGSHCDSYIMALIGHAVLGADTLGYNHKAEADVNGEIRIEDLPEGSYYLALVSKGRFTYSDKVVEIPGGGDLSLVKNFSYYHEFEKDPW